MAYLSCQSTHINFTFASSRNLSRLWAILMAFGFLVLKGIMKYHTNQLSIEIQLIRKFIESVQIQSLASPSAIGSKHLIKLLWWISCRYFIWRNYIFRQQFHKSFFLRRKRKCHTPFTIRPP